MQHILIKVEINDLVGNEKLDFDLFNEHGEIIYKKGQKIDSGFLLMLKYMNLYKKDTTITNAAEEIYEDPEIVNFTRELLLLGVKKKVSDISIEPDKQNAHIKFLTNGTLLEEIDIDKAFINPLTLRLKKLADLDLENTASYQEGDINISLFNKSVEYKLSCNPGKLGEKLILQLIDQEKMKIPELSEVFLPSYIMKELMKIVDDSKGAFIVVNHTELTINTFLYSLLNHLNEIGKTVITIEDSIKYQIPGVTQIKKNIRDEKVFESTFMEVLGQKHDAIMIKGIKDKKPIELALRATAADNFIIKGMQAGDSAQYISDVINMGIDIDVITSSITAILSQKYVKKLCEHCKEKYILPTNEVKKLFTGAGDIEIAFYREKGCPQCDNKGFSGQIAIYELLLMDDNLQKLIEKKPSLDEIRNFLKKNDFQDIKYDGIKKVLRGLTTIEEINKAFSKKA